jgi:leucyl-tRNA---protein transferase
MQLDADFRFINEEFFAPSVTERQYDALLADGWRHFGHHFFRYNLAVYGHEIRQVIPLRIDLARFETSKSQRRVLRRNADLDVSIEPVEVTSAIHDLFQRHRVRFRSDAPRSIYDFVSDGDAPTRAFQLTARSNGVLKAASFFDLGEKSVSAIYACFDPEDGRRSLGIFTMLKVIEHAASKGNSFYYHGYAYHGSSFYDYKKRFSALEAYDWRGRWRRYSG